eukprot:260260-Prorocentrum_minimum.AAC.1
MFRVVATAAARRRPAPSGQAEGQPRPAGGSVAPSAPSALGGVAVEAVSPATPRLAPTPICVIISYYIYK